MSPASNVCSFKWGKKIELIRLHILSCSLSSSTNLLSPRHVLSCLSHRLGGRLPSLGESLSASSLVFLRVNNSRETQKGPEDRTWLHRRWAGTAATAFIFLFFYFFPARWAPIEPDASSDEMKLLWGHAALSEGSVPINVINRSQWWLEPGGRRLIKSRTKAWLCRSPFDWCEEMDDWRQWSHVGRKKEYKDVWNQALEAAAAPAIPPFLFLFFFPFLICKVLMGLSGSLFALVHIFDKSPLSPTS